MKLKRCRMCGVAQNCHGCGWVEELETEDGGICVNCVSIFMGRPFQVVRADGMDTFGNMEEGVAYDNENPRQQISLLDPVGEEGPPPPIISRSWAPSSRPSACPPSSWPPWVSMASWRTR
jgi:hypothetical protein